MSLHKRPGASQNIFGLGPEKACGPNDTFNLRLGRSGHLFRRWPATKQGWRYHINSFIRALSRENGRNNEFKWIPKVEGTRCCRKGQCQCFYDGFSPLFLCHHGFPARNTHRRQPVAICVVRLSARIHMSVRKKRLLERSLWKTLQQRITTHCISKE